MRERDRRRPPLANLAARPGAKLAEQTRRERAAKKTFATEFGSSSELPASDREPEGMSGSVCGESADAWSPGWTMTAGARLQGASAGKAARKFELEFLTSPSVPRVVTVR